MLITSTIPNLINGVSQQPATLRLPSQAEEQENLLSSVADGLKRRPGSRHLAKLSATAWDDAFLHTINRDQVEQYVVSIRAGAVLVHHAKTGVQQVVNAPSGFGYLSGSVKEDFRAVTAADFTFILNRTRTPGFTADLTPARPNKALAYFRAGNYARNYKVTITGLASGTGQWQTPDGSVAAHAALVRTSNIAQEVINDFAAVGAIGPAGYTATRVDDILVLTRSGSVPFEITASDDAGNTNLVAIGTQVQRFADLPKVGIDDFVTEIAGDNVSNFDNYHVKYGAGVWKETVKGGELFRFDPATMPHVLVRESDGTFTFRPGDWIDRLVGDRAKLDDPSFIGRKINDIFFHRNRLGFLADENVILSKQGEFFDFWRATATTLLDTDPIDLAVTNSKVSVLNHALAFNKTLLLFSEGAQFLLSGGDILSAETASISQATEFESSPNCRPSGAGSYVYFPVARGAYTGVREYFVQEGNEQNDALDVTSHCPSYLPRDIFKLTTSTSEDITVAVSSATPNKLWIYKFFFGGEGKLQSAWSVWPFSTEDRILSAEFLESALYLVVARDDGTYLERLDIESRALEVDATFHYHVDRGFAPAAPSIVFDGTNSTITLPYETNEPLWVFVRGGDALLPEALVPGYTTPTSSTVVLEGDWTARKLFIGQRYRSEYTFSTFYLRQQSAGGGMVASDDGRLQVRRFAVNYADSGYFELHVQPIGRDATVRTFTGRRLGSSSSVIGEAVLGQAVLSDGRFSCPVMSKNKDVVIKIVTDSFLPASFSSAEFEATYHTRARRIG